MEKQLILPRFFWSNPEVKKAFEIKDADISRALKGDGIIKKFNGLLLVVTQKGK